MAKAMALMRGLGRGLNWAARLSASPALPEFGVNTGAPSLGAALRVRGFAAETAEVVEKDAAKPGIVVGGKRPPMYWVEEVEDCPLYTNEGTLEASQDAENRPDHFDFVWHFINGKKKEMAAKEAKSKATIAAIDKLDPENPPKEVMDEIASDYEQLLAPHSEAHRTWLIKLRASLIPSMDFEEFYDECFTDEARAEVTAIKNDYYNRLFAPKVEMWERWAKLPEEHWGSPHGRNVWDYWRTQVEKKHHYIIDLYEAHSKKIAAQVAAFEKDGGFSLDAVDAAVDPKYTALLGMCDTPEFKAQLAAEERARGEIEVELAKLCKFYRNIPNMYMDDVMAMYPDKLKQYNKDKLDQNFDWLYK